MRVGVQLPEVERFVPWTEYAEIAVTAEEVGFDSLWVGDHLLYELADGTNRGPWECWTLLSALAAVTERIQIGPLVASTSFHEPAMLAKAATTVDAVSGGRLTLGLGAGWNEREYRAYGFAFDHRVSRFEEAFTVVRTLVRSGRIDFTGRYYRLDDMVLDPPSRPDLPILVGSSGPRMLAITAPHMDAWNIWFADYGNDPAQLRPWLDRLGAAERTAGRVPGDIERTAALLVQLGDEPTRHNSVNPVGSVAGLGEVLGRLDDLGVAHVQLVLDPITITSVITVGDYLRRWRDERGLARAVPSR